MKTKLLSTLRAILLRHGRSVERHTGAEEAAKLVKKMWPVDMGYPLRRFGGDGDGAYVLPDDLQGIGAVISPGVSSIAKFEEDMATLGMECFLIDKSVQGPPIENDRFHFTPKFLGLRDSTDYVTLDTFVDSSAPGDTELLLQMDIEGAEWGILANASPQLLRRFRIMAIEFHQLERILYSELHRHILERILLTHNVVYIHVNNNSTIRRTTDLEIPDFMEVTFFRKDRGLIVDYARNFPNPLDIINIPNLAPIDLPSCWIAPPRSVPTSDDTG